MEPSDSLTHWSARAAFALYVLALAVGVRTGQGKATVARGLWTAACALMFVHVALAFDRVHHWSHAAAYQDTARQTADLFSLNWGGGLYANYALLLVWLADICWWWCGRQSYESRRTSVAWSIQGFLAFMWFNATVVFGHHWFRWASLGCFLILAALIAAHRANPQNKTASTGIRRKQF